MIRKFNEGLAFGAGAALSFFAIGSLIPLVAMLFVTARIDPVSESTTGSSPWVERSVDGPSAVAPSQSATHATQSGDVPCPS